MSGRDRCIPDSVAQARDLHRIAHCCSSACTDPGVPPTCKGGVEAPVSAEERACLTEIPPDLASESERVDNWCNQRREMSRVQPNIHASCGLLWAKASDGQLLQRAASQCSRQMSMRRRRQRY